MDAREEIPRISVENLPSWQRLQNGLDRTVSQRVDDEIRQDGADNEREQIWSHVLQYINQTLAHAQPNLRINGQPYEDLEDTEPFDEVLDRQIWSLADTRMQWFKRIAETRRKIPPDLAAALAAALEENHAFDTSTIFDLTTEDPSRFDDVRPKESYNELVQCLSALGHELDQTLPDQLKRTQETKAITADIKTHKLFDLTSRT